MTPQRPVAVELDLELAQRLAFIARQEGLSHEELLARIIEGYPKRSGQRRVAAGVTEAGAARLAAAAATFGVSEEQLIAEAIETYAPPKIAVSSGLIPALLALLLVLPPGLMFLSPPITPSGSVVQWVVFAAAMAACGLGVLVLIVALIYAEWVMIKYGVLGLVAATACGTVAVLTMFAYLYWILGSLAPASFNQPISRVDALYFALGTFTTTGTGRFSPRSQGAELLVTAQVVLGWSFVAVLVALLVPRAAAAHRRLGIGRIVVYVDRQPPHRL